MELLTEPQRALFARGGCLGDYDVLKPIGKGKFSVVYKAQRRCDGVAVALKKIAIFDLMDARAREKTLKEVRLVQSVAHANLVEYLDAFLDGKELYIAFEWADAGDLKRQIRKSNERQMRLDERTIWRYFSQLCAAILHLHRARIMHRDLKPANILLTTQGVIKVGDLGLGRHLSEDTLEAHSKVGTPLYMSPEVLKGEGYDWKSDVWSLGCILYELAMLRSPFKSEGLNLYGLFQKINKCDYEPIPDVYSDHLRALVTRMISLDATRRPSMEQVWGACQTRPSTATLATAQPVAQRTSTRIDREEDATADHRKKAPASPTPAPSSSTATSRPSSQQSDGSSHSSNVSRPPSSSKKTAPQPHHQAPTEVQFILQHEAAAMELLYDRLQLLPRDGDEDAHSGITRHHFASESRAVEPWAKSPHERFQEMCRTAIWLLRLISDSHGGVECFSKLSDEQQAPVARAQLLLLTAEHVGIAVSEVNTINAASLTAGCGIQVLQFLTVLSEQAIQATRRQRQRPVYPRNVVDVLDGDEQWEVQSDDHNAASGDSTTSTSLHDVHQDDEDENGMVDARWLVVREPERRPHGDGDEATAMIDSRVDPTAWRREVERVHRKLQSQRREGGVDNSGGWFTRLGMLRRQRRATEEAHERTYRVLQESSRYRQRQLETMTKIETRIQKTHEPIEKQYAATAERLQHVQAAAQSLVEAVATRAQALSTLEMDVKTKIHQLDDANARVADTTPLLQIKTQLQRLQQDNHKLGVQTQIARAELWEKKSTRSR